MSDSVYQVRRNSTESNIGAGSMLTNGPHGSQPNKLNAHVLDDTNPELLSSIKSLNREVQARETEYPDSTLHDHLEQERSYSENNLSDTELADRLSSFTEKFPKFPEVSLINRMEKVDVDIENAEKETNALQKAAIEVMLNANSEPEEFVQSIKEQKLLNQIFYEDTHAVVNDKLAAIESDNYKHTPCLNRWKFSGIEVNLFPDNMLQLALFCGNTKLAHQLLAEKDLDLTTKNLL